jgi:hypothetical protein
MSPTVIAKRGRGGHHTQKHVAPIWFALSSHFQQHQANERRLRTVRTLSGVPTQEGSIPLGEQDKHVCMGGLLTNSMFNARR